MRRDFVSGVIWRAGGLVGRQGITVLFGIVLARVLGPEAFGVVTMATIFLGFVQLLNNLGIGSSMIRAKESEFGQVERSSLFWFALLLSSGLAVLCTALGFALARFYDEPQLPLVVALLSLSFPISALQLVHNITLTRALRFRTMSFIDLSSVVFGGAVGVAVAWRGGGVWSLVAQNLVTTVVGCLLHWMTVRFWPSFRFDREVLRGHLRIGGYLVLSEMVGFAGRNVDNVLIGRLFGSAPLALYARAYSFLYLELYGVRTVIYVLFPTLAAAREDMARNKGAVLRVAGVVSLFTWPCACGLALVADPFVRVVFDESWVGMIPLLRALAPIALWESLVALQGTLFQLAGRTDLQLRAVTASNVVCIVGMVAGIPWGPLGIALGYAFGSLISGLWSLRQALRLAQASLGDVAREVWGVGVCCVPLTIVGGLTMIATSHASPWLRLITVVGAGATAYVVAVLLLRPTPYRGFLDSVQALRSRAAEKPSAPHVADAS